jgi:hypothetical protein
LDLRSVRRFLVRGVVEEGTNGGQPQVAAAGTDFTRGLQVVEKGRDVPLHDNPGEIYRDKLEEVG